MRSGQWKLESTGDNSSHRQVFVDLLPTERRTTEFDLHLFEIRIGRVPEAAIARCRKSKDATIMQLEEHIPALDPSSHRKDFLG